jgi:hypothetical protein
MSLRYVIYRSGFVLVTALWLTGCQHAPHEATLSPAAPRALRAASPPAKPDPDLHRPPPVRLLAIDWPQVVLTDDADASALWERIAPTGADWDDKLREVPAAVAHPLALALLRAGNFTCTTPPPAAAACAKPIYDVPPPAETAGLADPCLRRLLALWAIDQLDEDDVPAIKAALLAIAAIPPPESQLVEAALRAIPRDDQDTRLALLASAARAGQHELVDASVGGLDELHLIDAVRRDHIAGALDVLSAEGERTTYLAAISDEALAPHARITAITELATLPSLEPTLDPDLQAALRAAVKAKDCQVAASAARVLDQHGDHRFVPRRPHTTSVAQLMRAMCMLVSYEALQLSDETSLLASYLPARGLERITITYDAQPDDDPDHDGDPHTTHSAELIPRSEAVLPEVEDLVRAMRHCTGTICVSDEHEVRFVWSRGGEPLLSRIELAERPPCTAATP